MLQGTATFCITGAMDAFFHMGGYAAYIWPAYAVSALGLGGLTVFVWLRGRSLARRLKDFETRRDQARPVGAPAPTLHPSSDLPGDQAASDRATR